MTWKARVSAALVTCAAGLLTGCELLPLFMPNPIEACEPGAVDSRSCGLCEMGENRATCGDDQRWHFEETCDNNPFDHDGDTFPNESCFASRGSCCGDLPDCDDENAERWPGHGDVDEDGYLDYRCGGDDCDDDNPNVWYLHADLDDDGHHDERCGGTDCDDSDPNIWTGNADGDSDGHEDEMCGGDDCDDDDPTRWSNHADLDGDGHDAVSCGGDDCNDNDPLRWFGHTDIDGDGFDDAACFSEDDDEDSIYDCDDNDPTRWTGHADLDGDGHDASSCGGDDCDDECRFCLPGGTVDCEGGRDHDCDGLVDELSGCFAPVPTDLNAVDEPVATGESRDVFVVDSFAYVASRDGLYQVDLSGTEPAVVGFADVGASWDVVVARGYAYVVGPLGLSIIGVSEGVRMARVAGPVDTGDSRGVFLVDDTVLVASFDGLYAVNVASPEQPSITASLQGVDVLDSRDVAVDGDFAVVTRHDPRGGQGVYVVDISSLASGWMATTMSTNDLQEGEKVSIASPMAYVSTGEGVRTYLLTLLGALQPGSTVAITASSGIFAWSIIPHVSLVVANGGQLHAYDASDATRTPQFIDTLDFSDELQGGELRGVFVSDERAYVASDAGLMIVDLR